MIEYLLKALSLRGLQQSRANLSLSRNPHLEAQTRVWLTLAAAVCPCRWTHLCWTWWCEGFISMVSNPVGNMHVPLWWEGLITASEQWLAVPSSFLFLPAAVLSPVGPDACVAALQQHCAEAHQIFCLPPGPLKPRWLSSCCVSFTSRSSFYSGVTLVRETTHAPTEQVDFIAIWGHHYDYNQVVFTIIHQVLYSLCSYESLCSWTNYTQTKWKLTQRGRDGKVSRS